MLPTELAPPQPKRPRAQNGRRSLGQISSYVVELEQALQEIRSAMTEQALEIRNLIIVRHRLEAENAELRRENDRLLGILKTHRVRLKAPIASLHSSGTAAQGPTGPGASAAPAEPHSGVSAQ